MLIHPWDTALDPAEWQDWLASGDRFGMLAVNNLDPSPWPGPTPCGRTARWRTPLKDPERLSPGP